MKEIKIYGLYDNISNEIRYVGKTNKDDIQIRLGEHIRESKYKKRINKSITYKIKWINSVIEKGGEIYIKCLEIANEENWQDREKYWISKYEKLTNLTEGGDCGKVIQYTITYNDCKNYIKDNYHINSRADWFKTVNLIPENIPICPREVYLNRGWISWGDFLGTGRVQDNEIIKNYISYDDAKKWILINLDVKNLVEWKKLYKENKIPYFIPNRAERFYKKRGWISWSDFLNTDNIAMKYRKDIYLSYNDALELVRCNNIKSKIKYGKIKYVNLPSDPSKFYKEWISWGNFLGTGRSQDNLLSLDYISYGDAKKYVKENLSGIKSERIWKENVKINKIPNSIPNHPELFYLRKNRGWLGWKDFLNK